MRKIPALFALSLFAATAPAQSLRFISTAYPNIYCHFSSGCSVTPVEQYGAYTPTNVPVTCTLESRSFPGSTQNATGQYGYEYQLTLNNGGATDSNTVSVSSLTLEFCAPESFAFGEHASNFVWVVTSGGPVGLAPSDASLSDKEVTFQFDPPLTLATQTDQATNTFYFGMISGGAPEITQATLEGTTEDPVNGKLPFKGKLPAQTP